MSDKETIMLCCMIFLFAGMAYGVVLLVFMIGGMLFGKPNPQETK